MKKNKILSLIMAMVMVCILAINVQGVASAADDQECVDGSYLTHDESSEVTVGAMSRGIYLKSGSSPYPVFQIQKIYGKSLIIYPLYTQ